MRYAQSGHLINIAPPMHCRKITMFKLLKCLLFYVPWNFGCKQFFGYSRYQPIMNIKVNLIRKQKVDWKCYWEKSKSTTGFGIILPHQVEVWYWTHNSMNENEISTRSSAFSPSTMGIYSEHWIIRGSHPSDCRFKTILSPDEARWRRNRLWNCFFQQWYF